MVSLQKFFLFWAATLSFLDAQTLGDVPAPKAPPLAESAAAKKEAEQNDKKEDKDKKEENKDKQKEKTSETQEKDTASDNAAASAAPSSKYAAPAATNLIPGLFDFTPVVRKVIGSVVSIWVTQARPNSGEDELSQLSKKFSGTPFEDFFKNFSGKDGAPKKVHVTGSAFFIGIDAKNAYLATNAHIVENAVKTKILLNDKSEIPAVVHGIDSRTDLAVVSIELSDLSKEQRKNLVPLSWGDSSKTEVGQWVIAIGNPFSLGNTVTHGIISAKSRDLDYVGGATLTDDFIQHSAQINVGNSGGCLLDTNGNVIGINTVIVTPSGGNVGIGFAIPSNNAKKVIDQLLKNKKVQHGALGVSVQDFTKEMAEGLGRKDFKQGAVVARVDPKGPAGKAGVLAGDVIVKFDDVEITGKARLSRVVGDSSIDTTHKLLILRDGRTLTLSVTLGDFEKVNATAASKKEAANKPIETLGMTLINAPDAETQGQEGLPPEKGAFITKVAPDSPADEIGLARGDIITEVNQKKIESATEFQSIVKKAMADKKRFLFLRIKRESIDRFLSIRIDEEDSSKKEDEKSSDTSDKKEKKKEKEASKTKADEKDSEDGEKKSEETLALSPHKSDNTQDSSANSSNKEKEETQHPQESKEQGPKRSGTFFSEMWNDIKKKFAR
ncbi:hypothetical protein AGMMS49949_01540 [Alphaproteobacteria bacterium]|nr:hypothetical protein AGMMS49949_01540 [Alphaproteobacteria bacterium]GHS95927.1 hypothetical protein AGMMS50296_1480 [Alphaproteobacteria bacterium]